MAAPLRRSTRTIVAPTIFTIDESVGQTYGQKDKPNFCVQPPPGKRKRSEISTSAALDKSINNVVRQSGKTNSLEDPEYLRNAVMGLRFNNTNKNITVKQLLSKNFKNYRSRPSATSERATELVQRGLSENDVPLGLLSGPPVLLDGSQLAAAYPPRKIRALEPVGQTLQSALESLMANAPAPDDIALEKFKEGIPIVDDFSIGQAKQEPIDNSAYPGNHLPWPVFWKQVPQYVQGNIYLFVDDVIYTPISDVIKSGVFMVPLETPVEFLYEDRVLRVTLSELLSANGINLSQTTQHFRMLQGLLHKAGVHIRSDYAERLHELQSIEEKRSSGDKDWKPIQICDDKFPLVCKTPDIYMKMLGTRIHGALLVNTSGDKEPLPFQTFLTTVYSEPLPLESRLHILILHDSAVPIDRIAARFDCSPRSVHETIGTRLLIERHLIDQHFLLETTSTTIGDVMRPRSKIRRTHYVDLNKLVWKHFKECQSAGIQINGKHLKDQAMRYAREMGLESFRGSEGWLDAFKRRHRIDLKTMTGFPVCYENDMFDEVDKECRDDLVPYPTSFLPHPTGPTDDFATNFFSSLSSFPPQPPVPEPSSNHLQKMINSMMTPSTSSSASAVTANSMEATGHDNNGDTIFNVMRSCQIKVADKEISHALDTLRTYILAHDPPAMSLLVPLQERLAATTSGAIVPDMSQ